MATTATPGTVRDAGGDEPVERSVDEQFRSLMEGLRTTLPGIEVLLAFLLTLPVQSSFSELGEVQRGAYMVALVAAATAVVLLIAPSAHQRARSLGRDGEVRRQHQRHLLIAVRITFVGTIAGAVAIIAAVFLATSLVLNDVTAAVIALVIGGLAAWTWFWTPIMTFRHGGEDGR